MDRADVDLRNPTPGARPTPGASVFADPDQVLWRQFAEASTPDVFYRAWLALQCRMITGVTGGVVVLGPPDTGPYTPAAFWPEGGRNLRHLAEVAEKTLVERRGLVMPRAGRADDPSARPRYDVAYPIQVSGRLLGVVALDIAPRQEVDLQWALRQLQWGAAWLETLTLRGELTRTTVVRDRLQQVLDLVGAAFGHDRFYAAASAFVTAVATRLNCDRVSFGVVVRGRTRVQAISHSARFGEQTNVVRAVAEAMDEAIDQHATIVHPPPAGSRPVVTRAASELARQHGAGAICTVPLAEGGRVFGALTFERPADQPFDALAVDVCEALGVAPPLPDSMVGTMTAIPLPADFPADLQAQLFDRHRIEVPIAEWPVRAAREDGLQPLRLLRVSVAPYTDLGDVERLVDALGDLRLAGLGRQGRPASVAGRIASAE